MKALCLFLLAAGIASAETFNSPDQPAYMGFRHNGSGLFPSDCAPVTSWKEGNWAWVEETTGKSASDPGDDEAEKTVPGKTVKVPRMKDSQGENIVWKKELPYWGHGGIIFAKGRMFFMHEMPPCLKPGEEKDFEPGPILVCMDPNDGKVIWKRGVHGLSLLPAVEQEKAKKAFHDYTKWNWRRWAIHAELRRLVPFPGKNGQPPTPEKNRERVRELCRELRAMKCKAPDESLLKEILAGKKTMPNRKGSYSYVVMADETNGGREIYQAPHRYGFWFTGYSTHGNSGYGGYDMTGQRYAGEGFQTPVTDGERIYATTVNKVLVCFDLDGNQLWVVRFQPKVHAKVKNGNTIGFRSFEQIASPILAEGKVIIASNYDPSHMAFDVRTGQQVWEVANKDERGNDMGQGDAAAMCHPALMRVGGESCIFTRPDGQLVRVGDGKILTEKVGNGPSFSCLPVSPSGDTVYMPIHGNSSTANRLFAEPKKGLQAIRFIPNGPDRVKAERLWITDSTAENSSPVLVNGRLFALFPNREKGDRLKALDAETGKELASLTPRGVARSSAKGDVWWNPGEGLGLINSAGGYLFIADAGRNSTAMMSVIKADTLKVVSAENLILGGYPADMKPFSTYWGRLPSIFNGPYFSGNRMFIRAHEHIYCIGNPKEPLRLSKVHQ